MTQFLRNEFVTSFFIIPEDKLDFLRRKGLICLFIVGYNFFQWLVQFLVVCFHRTMSEDIYSSFFFNFNTKDKRTHVPERRKEGVGETTLE